MYDLFVRFCLTATLFTAVLGEIPPYIKVCKKHDPDINTCITNSILQLRERLEKGIPELGAPPIEPLTINQIRLLRGPVGARFDMNLTDVMVRGPSKFKIRDLKADVENVIFRFKLNFDELHFSGKYHIDSRILLLRLRGEGDITGNFTDYDSDVILKANKVKREDGVYIHFEKMKIRIIIGGSSVHLSNLFGADSILGSASNELLKSSSAIFVEEIKPALESTLSDLFTKTANSIVKNFSYDELFPDD